MKLREYHPPHPVALLAAASMGFLAVASTEAAATGAPSQPRMSSQEAEATIAEIKDIAADAEAVLASFSSPYLDREPVLEAADFELERISQWVQTETRWVPYDGILRGSAGVLMDRRGNSADRSVLLATLLEDAGFETRLVRTTLSAEEAEALQTRYLQSMAAERPSSAGATVFMPTAKSQEVQAQARELAALAGIPESATVGSGARFSEHWWVKVRVGSQWRNIDTMEASGSFAAHAGRLETFRVDNLPDRYYHRLDFKVIVERWEAGTLVVEEPLTQGIVVGKAPLFTELELDFLPMAEEWVLLDEDDEGLTAVEAAESARFWRPRLRVNDTVVLGEWFSAAGTLELPTTLATAKKFEAANEALATLGDTDRIEERPSHLAAVWLEYSVTDPGNGTQVIRRELFDLLGGQRDPASLPAEMSLQADSIRQRGLALQGRVATLVVTATPHGDAIDKAVFEIWRDYHDGFIALVYRAADWKDERVPVILANAWYRPVDLMAMASLRELWSRHRSDIYIDQVNVLSSHQIRVGGGLAFATDIVHHRVGVMPGNAFDSRYIRLEQGVLDTLVETTFTNADVVHNTFVHYSGRVNEPQSWIDVDMTERGLSRLGALPAHDRARIQTAVRNGARVVVSPHTYLFGDTAYASWWRIDPDGTTLGMGYRGWGTATAEYSKTDAMGKKATKEGAEEVGESAFCKIADATFEAFSLADTLDFPVPSLGGGGGGGGGSSRSPSAPGAGWGSISDHIVDPERRALINKIREAGKKTNRWGGIPECWGPTYMPDIDPTKK